MGLRAALTLGIERANRRWVIVLGSVLALMTVFGGALVSLRLSNVGHTSSAQLVIITWCLAWGAGIFVAFGLASRAFIRDHQEGIADLFERHAKGQNAYLAARIAGIAFIVALVVGGAIGLSGLILILSSHQVAESGRALAATLAALVYALFFSITISPLALCALGGRGRGSGYIVLLFCIGVPEMIARGAARWIPASFIDLISFPGALSAVRDSLLVGSIDPLRFVRASLVLAFAVGLSFLYLKREVARTREGARR